jgi:hypothetical protein
MVKGSNFEPLLIERKRERKRRGERERERVGETERKREGEKKIEGEKDRDLGPDSPTELVGIC